MILVDKDISKLVNDNQLIVEGFDSNNLGAVSYDLTVDRIIAFTNDSSEECETYELDNGEYVIIKTKEKLQIPDNLLGKIEEKNSIIRMGLVVSGPCYQPGHTTYAYLRVLNISKNKIKLTKGFKIAQIMFEELTGKPDVTYNQNNKASFNDEVTYRGFGNYENEYKKIVI